MTGIVKTNRLILREFNVADAESFFNLNSDPEIIKFAGDGSFATVAAAIYLANYDEYERNGFGR